MSLLALLMRKISYPQWVCLECCEIAALKAENAALKADITNLKSQQITEHGTVEFGGVTWQLKELVARDQGISVREIRNLIAASKFWKYTVVPDEGELKYGNADTLFDAMTAAIEYAKGEAE
jgi:hypothetical protein